MNRALVPGLVLAVTAALSGCGTSHEDAKPAPANSTTTSSAKLAAPVSPPPGDAATVIRFDPCTRISDEMITQAGLDPATRERSVGEIVTDTMTSIGCDFNRIAYVNGQKVLSGSITIMSRNTKLDNIRTDAELAVFNSDPIRGHAAALYRTPMLPGMCSAAMESPDGVLDVSLTVFPTEVKVPEPCDQIRELADLFAGAL